MGSHPRGSCPEGSNVLEAFSPSTSLTFMSSKFFFTTFLNLALRTGSTRVSLAWTRVTSFFGKSVAISPASSTPTAPPPMIAIFCADFT